MVMVEVFRFWGSRFIRFDSLTSRARIFKPISFHFFLLFCCFVFFLLQFCLGLIFCLWSFLLYIVLYDHDTIVVTKSILSLFFFVKRKKDEDFFLLLFLTYSSMASFIFSYKRK